ncbi:hypothetical protein ACKWTF_016437 [Chironomus riparius]
MTHLDAKKMFKKFSELQKHFPKNRQKIIQNLHQKATKSRIQNAKKEKKRKPDPFLTKQNLKTRKIGQIILNFDIFNKRLRLASLLMAKLKIGNPRKTETNSALSFTG